MTDYASNISATDAAAWLADAASVAITTHFKPDGDAVGSSLALARTLRHLDPDRPVELWYAGALPDFLAEIASGTPLRHLDTTPPTEADDPAAFVIVDTGSWSQLGFVREFATGRSDRTLIVDHHLRGDAEIADRRIVETTAPAAAQIVAGICSELLAVPPKQLPVDVATPLYLGIATDTGWFRHSNTTPTMFRLVADLLEAGVSSADLFRLIEQRDRVSRLRLFGRALSKLEMHADNSIALVMLDAQDFKESHGTSGDTGGFADRMLAVESVQVAVVLTESTDHTGAPITKISFRSKPGPDEIDVNQVAGTLGGGGHARAAGARLHKTLTETRDAVLTALAEA
ncbi:MAG: DHH family phosphoesterase [Planctomycetota bacterium]|nr:DHH family phosphoesterase [Planctomycetota bacterium]